MAADKTWIPTPFGDTVPEAKDNLASVSYDDSADTLFDGPLPELPTEQLRDLDEDATIFSLGISEQRMEHEFLHHYWIRKKGTMFPSLWGPLLQRNTAQKRFLRFIINQMRTPGPKRIACLKSRQTGASTAFIAFMVYVLQHLPWNGLIITHSDDSATELMRIAREMYERLPITRRKALRYNHKHALVWGQRRQVERDAGNRGHEASLVAKTAKGNYVGSGSSVSIAQLSEAAKYDTLGDLDDQMVFILSILQAMPKNGPSIGIAEFTANGAIGWAYETFMSAINRRTAADDMRWIPYFISWLHDPSTRRKIPEDYNWSDWPREDWDKEKLILSYGATLENLYYRRFVVSTEMRWDFDLFDQEYPTTPQLAFMTSGRSVFSRRLLLPQHLNVCEPIERLSLTAVDSETATTETVWQQDQEKTDDPPTSDR